MRTSQFSCTTAASGTSVVRECWGVLSREALASTSGAAAAGLPSPVKLAWGDPLGLATEALALAFALAFAAFLTLFLRVLSSSLPPIVAAKRKRKAKESTAAVCVRHECARAGGSVGPRPVHTVRACSACACVQGRQRWCGTHTTVYQCGCVRATAGLARQSAGAKQRCSNVTQGQGPPQGYLY